MIVILSSNTYNAVYRIVEFTHTVICSFDEPIETLADLARSDKVPVIFENNPTHQMLQVW